MRVVRSKKRMFGMRRRLDSKRRPSSPSSVNLRRGSIAYWRKRTLGDKLHRLAVLSPRRVRVVELLVDQMLRKAK